jgi:long-subunit acyl-CoA synthetase (AMP-forming)
MTSWNQHPLVDKYDLSSVGAWGCAAAPLGNDLIEAVEMRTNIPIREGYGMTESTCVISYARRENLKRGTVGPLMPNMSAKIVDGELLVKGPNVMKGYLRNPEADIAAFTEDGWMRTGDIARFDDDDLFIIDRVKEVSVSVRGLEWIETDASVRSGHQV